MKIEGKDGGAQSGSSTVKEGGFPGLLSQHAEDGSKRVGFIF